MLNFLVNFKVLVLANGPWPLSLPYGMSILPAALTTCVKSFAIFYAKSNTSGKANTCIF